jgi:hypothetical protein
LNGKFSWASFRHGKPEPRLTWMSSERIRAGLDAGNPMPA